MGGLVTVPLDGGGVNGGAVLLLSVVGAFVKGGEKVGNNVNDGSKVLLELLLLLLLLLLLPLLLFEPLEPLLEPFEPDLLLFS